MFVRLFGYSIAASVLIAAPAPAQTLQPKQCLPIAEINAILKAEGQRTLILANREAINDPTGNAKDWTISKYANAVTSDADGSLGYKLEGDLPRAKASTIMCVGARLTNIRLFDATKPGVPKDAQLGGLFTSSAFGLEKKGMRVMLVADTVHIDGAGEWRGGAPLVVFGDVKDGTGSINTMNSKGPQVLAVMGSTEYTPEARRRLGMAEAK